MKYSRLDIEEVLDEDELDSNNNSIGADKDNKCRTTTGRGNFHAANNSSDGPIYSPEYSTQVSHLPHPSVSADEKNFVGKIRILYRFSDGSIWVIGPHWHFSAIMLAIIVGAGAGFIFLVIPRLDEWYHVLGGVASTSITVGSFIMCVVKDPGIVRGPARCGELYMGKRVQNVTGNKEGSSRGQEGGIDWSWSSKSRDRIGDSENSRTDMQLKGSQQLGRLNEEHQWHLLSDVEVGKHITPDTIGRSTSLEDTSGAAGNELQDPNAKTGDKGAIELSSISTVPSSCKPHRVPLGKLKRQERRKESCEMYTESDNDYESQTDVESDEEQSNDSDDENESDSDVESGVEICPIEDDDDEERETMIGELPETRICDICGVVAPSESWHCVDCQVCVEGYDHHCPWTSKCIGRKNIVAFYVWVMSALISVAYMSITAGISVPQVVSYVVRSN